MDSLCVHISARVELGELLFSTFIASPEIKDLWLLARRFASLFKKMKWVQFL